MNDRPPTPGAQLSQIEQLRQHPGWKLYEAEFAERFTALTLELLNLSTPAEKAEHLRQARSRIEQTFKPETVLNNMISKQSNRAEQLRLKGDTAGLPRQ